MRPRAGPPGLACAALGGRGRGRRSIHTTCEKNAASAADDGERKDPRERTAPQQRDEQAGHARLKKHRAEPQTRSARHRRRQNHRQQSIRHADHHHRGPADRGEVRVREDVGEHEPRQKVIDLVESDEHAERGGGEDVEKREHDVRADGTRQRRVAQAPGDVNADQEDARADGDRRPRHAAVSWSQKCATMPTMPMRTRANAV